MLCLFGKSVSLNLNIDYTKSERFDETYLTFDDVHGLKLELVEREEGEVNEWAIGDVTPEVAIKGFADATLFSGRPEETARLLVDVMGLEEVAEEGNLIRFKSHGDIGNIIDLRKSTTGRGQMGVGTVHHIAWRATSDGDQLDWKEHAEKHGYTVTPVRDRNYFNAIYFREHGEILFEIATDPPGFAHDESYETMGSELKLPSQYEMYREKLNHHLVPIEIEIKNLD